MVVIFSLVTGLMKIFIALCAMKGLTWCWRCFHSTQCSCSSHHQFPSGKMRNICHSSVPWPQSAPLVVGCLPDSLYNSRHGSSSSFLVCTLCLSVGTLLTQPTAIFGAVLFITFAFAVPGEFEPFDKNGSIDYIGAYLGVGGFKFFAILFGSKNH
jgi:hypothetical protein